MIYKLTVTNGFKFALKASDGASIAPGAVWTTTQNQSGVTIDVPLFGSAVFQYVGDAPITVGEPVRYGVLVAYRGKDALGRYDGEGDLHAHFKGDNQLNLSGMTLTTPHLSPILVGDGG